MATLMHDKKGGSEKDELITNKKYKNIMTKAEVIAEISRQTGVEKEKALKVVEALMVVVKEQTKAGEDIFLRGFGTFTTKTRAQKIGRLIKENKSVVVPEHKIPFFKPCEEFKDMLMPDAE